MSLCETFCWSQCGEGPRDLDGLFLAWAVALRQVQGTGREKRALAPRLRTLMACATRVRACKPRLLKRAFLACILCFLWVYWTQ